MKELRGSAPQTLIRPANDGHLSVHIHHREQIVWLVSDSGYFQEGYNREALTLLIEALVVALHYLPEGN